MPAAFPGKLLALVVLVLGFARLLVAPLHAAPDFLLSATPTRASAGEDGQQSFILREVARQAVVLAALHEAGRSPGDEVFDAYPAADASPPLRLSLNAPWENNRVAFKLELTGAPSGAPALDLSLDARGRPSERADALARSLAPLLSGPLAAWLRDHVPASATPARARAAASALVATDVRRLEAAPDPVGCFALLRHWHAVAATEGRTLSPETLAGLARAYILLGESTRHHWSALSSVCAARALLYSALLGHRHPGHALAAETRAWVLTLGGYHAAALVELDAIAARETKPDWLPVLDAAARYQTDRLAEFTRARQTWSPLAAWLAVISVENQRTPNLYARRLEEFSPFIPLNPRGVYVANHVLGVGGRHRTTQDGLEFAPRWLARRVPALAGLPEPLRAQVARARDAASVRAFALTARDVDDGAYPSWGALGRILWDTQFAFTADRLHFMAQMWSVSTRDEVREMSPAFAGHPFLAALATLERGDSRSELRAGPFASVRLGDVVEGMDAYVNWAEGLSARFADMRASAASSLLWSLSNDDIHSLGRLYLHANERARRRDFADKLATSPFHPEVHADAILLDSAWEDRLAAARERLPGNPLVAFAAGRRLVQEGRAKEAIPELELARRELGESRIYDTLAEAYLESGDEAGWLATRLAFGKLPDTGLGRARNSLKIADHYLDTRRASLALPHAEAAGESWAEWAMEAAALANAIVGDHARARLWISRDADRYGEKLGDRIAWHAIAGYGERDELLALLRAEPPGREGRPRDHELLGLGGDEVVRLYLATYRDRSDNYYLMLAGLVALEGGDTAGARALFARLPAEFATERVRDATRVANHRLADLFVSDLDEPIDDETFAARVAAILREQGILHGDLDRYAPDLLYFAARFLRIRERPAARTLLDYAARHGAQPDFGRYVLPLIAREFSRQGLDLTACYREPAKL